MSPFRSTARLGMNRWVESAPHVACWRGVEIAPPVTGISYQRMRPTFCVPPLPTVCVSHSDSRPPRFVYWFCIISRYDRVSSAFPSASGTVDGPTLNVETPTFVGPVKVELAGLAQSTSHFQVRTA